MPRGVVDALPPVFVNVDTTKPAGTDQASHWRRGSGYWRRWLQAGWGGGGGGNIIYNVHSANSRVNDNPLKYSPHCIGKGIYVSITLSEFPLENSTKATI